MARHNLTKAHKREARGLGGRTVKRTSPTAATRIRFELKRRWRCAKRCGEGRWDYREDIPSSCPGCGGRIEYE